MPSPILSDDELVADVKRGSLDAFSLLVRRYENRVFSFLLQKTGNRHDAEDLAQTTFLTAYRQLHRYEPQDRFGGWLFTIAHRQSISHYRRFFRKKRLYEEAEKQMQSEEPDPAALAEENDESRTLWQTAREVLTQSQHAALWLYYAEGMPVAEVGNVLRKSEGSVKVILHRARKALAAHLTLPEEVRQAKADGSSNDVPEAEASMKQQNSHHELFFKPSQSPQAPYRCGRR